MTPEVNCDPRRPTATPMVTCDPKRPTATPEAICKLMRPSVTPDATRDPLGHPRIREIVRIGMVLEREVQKWGEKWMYVVEKDFFKVRH
jgi:hypothetical protein